MEAGSRQEQAARILRDHQGKLEAIKCLDGFQRVQSSDHAVGALRVQSAACK